MSQRSDDTNAGLRHITVLEEAHNLLRNCQATSSPETGGGMAAKSVEMISNAIAEMRTYGESFVVVDQAPGLLDMAAIRNTNTKIIMRLPDEGDRRLVGKAANLNDDQIQELARLQRGVAAVYQNEWIEPVLCHIGKHERKVVEQADCLAPGSESLISPEEMRYLNSCMLNPLRLDEPSETDFIDCVGRADIPDSLKARMVEMARTPLSRRKSLFEWSAYRYFNMAEVLSEVQAMTPEEAKDAIFAKLKSKWDFEDESDLEAWNPSRYLFVQSMVNEHMNELRRRGLGSESAEQASALAALSAGFAQIRPVI